MSTVSALTKPLALLAYLLLSSCGPLEISIRAPLQAAGAVGLPTAGAPVPAIPATTTPAAAPSGLPYVITGLNQAFVLNEGQTLPLAVEVHTPGGAKVSNPEIDWSMDDPSVAQVKNGQLIAKRVGATTLRVTARGATTSVPVQVMPATDRTRGESSVRTGT